MYFLTQLRISISVALTYPDLLDSTKQKIKEGNMLGGFFCGDILGAEAICQGDPGYSKYFNCELFNNINRVHHKYMSSNIAKTELSQIQEEAYPLEDPILEGDAPDLEKAVLRHDARRFQ